MSRAVAGAYVVTLMLASLFLRADPPAAKAQPPERWQQRMQGLANVMSELLPELAARNGNLAIIEKNAKKLADLSHDLVQESGDRAFLPPPDADPSIALLAGRFDLDARHAYRTIHQGDVEYGKQLLRTATSFCIACHTRHGGMPDRATFPLGPRVASLSRSERAELLAATLRFDEALAELQAIVADDSLARAQPLEWERAIHHALAIAVRVESSPDRAGAIVTRVLAQPAAPEFMKRNAARWDESIASWKAETRVEDPTEAGLYAEMKRLLDAARQLQRYPADRAADILYLRTAATAHSLLRIAPDGAHAAEAIYVAGMAYDVLNDPPFWSINEVYYEACIRRTPHTELAEECYRRYEEAIHLGYSGSGGLFIPAEARATLARLKQLARAEKRAGQDPQD